MLGSERGCVFPAVGEAQGADEVGFGDDVAFVEFGVVVGGAVEGD